MIIRCNVPSSRKGRALVKKYNIKKGKVKQAQHRIQAIWGRGDHAYPSLSTHYKPRA